MSDTMSYDIGDIVVDTTKAKVTQVVSLDVELGKLAVSRPAGLTWLADLRDLRPATDQERRDWDIACRMVDGLRDGRRVPMPVEKCKRCGDLNLAKQRARARRQSSDAVDTEMIAHHAEAHT